MWVLARLSEDRGTMTTGRPLNEYFQYKIIHFTGLWKQDIRKSKIKSNKHNF